jgi:RHS repeat-associated protein
VAGQQFEYSYDDIGNRTSTRKGGDANGANLRQDIYTSTILNQITNRTDLGYRDIIGIASPQATINVNGSTNTARRGEYFRSEINANNTSSAVYQPVTVSASQGGTNSAPISGNLYISQTPEVFIHDADGNLIQDGRWTYTWDAENRLVKLETFANAPVGSKRRLEFKYDCRGRRAFKKVTDLDNSAVLIERRYLYDSWNLSTEIDQRGNLVQSYVWGLDLSGTLQKAVGIGGLLGVKPGGGSLHFASSDANGNVVRLVDGAAATISASYEYSTFGEPIRITGPMGLQNPYRFSTKYSDDQSELINFGYRYYRSLTAKWLSKDPHGERGGVNLYAFVHNNPLGYLDPRGGQLESVIEPVTEGLIRILPRPEIPPENIIKFPRPPDTPPLNPPAPIVPGPKDQDPSNIGAPSPTDPSMDLPPLNKLNNAPESAVRTCPKDRLETLTKRVDDACEKSEACRPTDCFWQLQEKYRRFNECINARSRRERECWGGGDIGHIEQIEGRKKGMKKCEQYMNEQRMNGIRA